MAMDHRGKFQVHGVKGVLLDSEPWYEDTPLPALKAHHHLSGLEIRVSENHWKDHKVLAGEQAFSKTHRLIDGVARSGGHGPYKFSWPKPSRKDQRRVDTEISHGMAFI